MTALEAYKLGVRFDRDDRASIVGAKGPSAVMKQVGAEVARRVESMKKPPRLHTEIGSCDACGDDMGFWGGWCQFCTLARRVALKQMGKL